jgi:hypothetical protein
VADPTAPEPFSEEELDKAYADGRRALAIATVGMWLCVAVLVALAVSTFETVLVPTLMGLTFCCLGTLAARTSRRALDRTYERRRLDLQNFLAGRRHPTA